MVYAHAHQSTVPGPTLDPFDLDISVLPATSSTAMPFASDDSCGSTCGTSCVSSVA